ncbi:hypothetical protein E2C01_102015 [Portunus trituberculatus]|uniref:Uncharacterized protein n=1 Tax=Portunus trituberculatus TaxID=210409 RepID=A0A5B7KLK8_PORTR|nr:hypothetical protein [Portunus trituberculatus]
MREVGNKGHNKTRFGAPDEGFPRHPSRRHGRGHRVVLNEFAIFPSPLIAVFGTVTLAGECYAEEGGV